MSISAVRPHLSKVAILPVKSMNWLLLSGFATDPLGERKAVLADIPD
jgi:hypothetical protein